MDEITADKLTPYLGKFVCLMNDTGQVFGNLGTDGTLFGVAPHGFPLEAVKEIRVIEVPKEKNLVRAVIVLK